MWGNRRGRRVVCMCVHMVGQPTHGRVRRLTFLIPNNFTFTFTQTLEPTAGSLMMEPTRCSYVAARRTKVAIRRVPITRLPFAPTHEPSVKCPRAREKPSRAHVSLGGFRMDSIIAGLVRVRAWLSIATTSCTCYVTNSKHNSNKCRRLSAPPAHALRFLVLYLHVRSCTAFRQTVG